MGRRGSSDPMLLWLWLRRAAVALIQPSLVTSIRLECGPKKQNKTKQAVITGKKVHSEKTVLGVPVVVQWLTNPTRNHEVEGSVPALAQWVNDPALP